MSKSRQVHFHADCTHVKHLDLPLCFFSWTLLNAERGRTALHLMQGTLLASEKASAFAIGSSTTSKLIALSSSARTSAPSNNFACSMIRSLQHKAVSRVF